MVVIVKILFNEYKKLQDNVTSNVYSNIHILNIKEFHKHKNTLCNMDYLPVLLRRLCGTDYYKNLSDKNNARKIKDKIHQTSTYNRKMIVDEFITWCKEYDYLNLINNNEYKRLQTELKEINKEIEYIKEVFLEVK